MTVAEVKAKECASVPTRAQPCSILYRRLRDNMANQRKCPICGGLLDKHGCCPKCNICVPKERR